MVLIIDGKTVIRAEQLREATVIEIQQGASPETIAKINPHATIFLFYIDLPIASALKNQKGRIFLNCIIPEVSIQKALSESKALIILGKEVTPASVGEFTSSINLAINLSTSLYVIYAISKQVDRITLIAPLQGSEWKKALPTSIHILIWESEETLQDVKLNFPKQISEFRINKPIHTKTLGTLPLTVTTIRINSPISKEEMIALGTTPRVIVLNAKLEADVLKAISENVIIGLGSKCTTEMLSHLPDHVITLALFDFQTSKTIKFKPTIENLIVNRETRKDLIKFLLKRFTNLFLSDAQPEIMTSINEQPHINMITLLPGAHPETIKLISPLIKILAIKTAITDDQCKAIPSHLNHLMLYCSDIPVINLAGLPAVRIISLTDGSPEHVMVLSVNKNLQKIGLFSARTKLYGPQKSQPSVSMIEKIPPTVKSVVVMNEIPRECIQKLPKHITRLRFPPDLKLAHYIEVMPPTVTCLELPSNCLPLFIACVGTKGTVTNLSFYYCLDYPLDKDQIKAIPAKIDVELQSPKDFSLETAILFQDHRPDIKVTVAGRQITVTSKEKILLPPEKISPEEEISAFLAEHRVVVASLATPQEAQAVEKSTQERALLIAEGTAPEEMKKVTYIEGTNEEETETEEEETITGPAKKQKR